MALPSNKSFLGVGWSYPLAAVAGQTAMAVYEEDVRQAILIVLLTNPGERIMRPSFGAGLKNFVFEPISFTTMSTIAQRVEDALIDWEPRIDVISVTVTPDTHDPATLNLDIVYRVRSTNNVGNIVYPFFLGEGSAK